MWTENEHFSLDFLAIIESSLLTFYITILLIFLAVLSLLPCAGSVVVECGPSCPVAWGISVPRPGIEPVSPTLVGRLFTTGPPGKSLTLRWPCPSLGFCRSVGLRLSSRLPTWELFQRTQLDCATFYQELTGIRKPRCCAWELPTNLVRPPSVLASWTVAFLVGKLPAEFQTWCLISIPVTWQEAGNGSIQEGFYVGADLGKVSRVLSGMSFTTWKLLMRKCLWFYLSWELSVYLPFWIQVADIASLLYSSTHLPFILERHSSGECRSVLGCPVLMRCSESLSNGRPQIPENRPGDRKIVSFFPLIHPILIEG